MAARKRTDEPQAPPEAGPATEEQAEALASEPPSTASPDAGPDARVRTADSIEALHNDVIARRNERRRIDESTITGGEPETEAHVHDFDRQVGTTERPRYATVTEAESAGPVERLGADVFPVLVCACGARVLGPRVGG